MTGLFRGSATALVTPFDGDTVNLPVLGELISYQIENGTDALVLLGTTGEPSAMTESEKESVLSYTKERAAGRALLLAGAGSNNVKEAVHAVKRAEKYGFDGTLVVTPYYNKCTQEGLLAYYRAVSEASPLPFFAYNVPSRTGVNLLPETMARIAEFKNAAGVKEASGDMAHIMEVLRLTRGKCDVLSGDDSLTLPILCAGGSGVVSVLSNLAPAGVKSLCTAALRGDLSMANRLSDRLLPLAKACFADVNPIPVKAALRMLGYSVGEPRLPLTPLSPDKEERMKNAMRTYGLRV